MPAYTGTNLIPNPPKWQAGLQYTAIGSYTLGTTITNADTITWSNILPPLDNRVRILGFRLHGQELDTNASPTLAIVVGTTTDTDGYLASKTAGDATGQMQFFGDGAYIGTRQADSRDIVLTTSGTLGTGAASGTVWISVDYLCEN